MAEEESIFEHFIKMDVSKHVDKKNGLSYLSWIWCWTMLKKYDPKATKSFKKFPEYDWNSGKLTGRDVDYCLTQQGCYVECTVTIKGHSETETLPCFAQRPHKAPIATTEPDMMLINKTKQRCFVKCCALFGLGLNLYAGEDEPLDNTADKEQVNELKSSLSEFANLSNQPYEKLVSESVNWAKVDTIDELDKNQAKALSTSINRRITKDKQEQSNDQKKEVSK